MLNKEEILAGLAVIEVIFSEKAKLVGPDGEALIKHYADVARDASILLREADLEEDDGK